MLAHMAGVIAKYHGTDKITQMPQKGAAREALAATIIEPWFGPSLRVGTGFAIDSYGNTSPQCDTVLYWPDVQPSIAMGGISGPGLFPIESVASIIEVKSTLTKTDLIGALDNVNYGCHGLKMKSGSLIDERGYQAPHVAGDPYACILAFKSVLARDTLEDILLQSTDKWDAVCVLGENGGLYAREKVARKIAGPLVVSHDTDEERLLAFSVTQRDSIQHLKHRRGIPSLASYVTDTDYEIDGGRPLCPEWEKAHTDAGSGDLGGAKKLFTDGKMTPQALFNIVILYVRADPDYAKRFEDQLAGTEFQTVREALLKSLARQ